MIAVLGSKLSDGNISSLGMSATIGIGHLITAGTMMWIHAWRIGQLSRWLDSTREDSEDEEIVEESDDDEIEEVLDDTPEDIEIDIPPPVTENDDVELVDLD